MAQTAILVMLWGSSVVGFIHGGIDLIWHIHPTTVLGTILGVATTPLVLVSPRITGADPRSGLPDSSCTKNNYYLLPIGPLYVQDPFHLTRPTLFPSYPRFLLMVS
jgi:hypothetical protein